MAKKKKKKLYKTVIHVEVLSEERLGYIGLDDLHEQITTGSCSGRIFQPKKTIILKGKAAVKATKAQGSDPSFFFMDEQGNKLEE